MASATIFLPTIITLSTFIIFFIHVQATDHDDRLAINVTKHFSFPDFNTPKATHNLMLLGSSAVDKMGRIQIPDKAQKHLAGRAIYAYPIRVFDPVTRTPASFQTTFSFQLETTQSSVSSDGGGSGFTFMLAPDEFTVGRPGPWLGMLNDACDEEYKAVGIEFDTRENVEFGDPNDNHIGINLGSIVSTITINVSEFGVDLKNGEIQRAWIDYNGQKRLLDIRVGSDSLGYPSKPVFSGELDISGFLKEYMFVGFSASTGNFTQIHNLISWNLTSTSRASLRVPSPETCESKIIKEDGDGGGGGDGGSLDGFFIFMSVVLLAVVAFVSLYYNRKRGREKTNDVAMLPPVKERPRPPNKPRRFTISEVSSATRCFDELHKVASDERSDTYRGTLLNGRQVIVKRFSIGYFKSHGVNRRHVCKEIKAMSRLRHPNLVPIRGWCFDHQETMVVYDYIPNGVLDDWLYGIGVLPWSRRLKVVRDVAQALNYLHTQKLAHKNVKTSSVFINVSVRGLLGDFGFVMPDAESESNRFMEAVSQPTDVFEFGVLLLEVVAGRNRYESRTESNPESDELDLDLLHWAWTMHEMNEKEKVVDGRIGSVLNMDQAVGVIEIGLLCTLKENTGRPSMQEVIEYLNFETEIPELPSRRPMALFPYTSTTQLCSNSYMCASFK
ncbi:hypothetical protein L1987_10661 [Smallanthus sonchifolius]|uniref:Uncharacterized protein n=1 Tax=Smallanthus sonchifolius TaxID=185202 RepID=A0ACB9J952_9ASTR|nr:hypothetical protein L1987_10661 [Smallanthus sonchifolius]